MLGGPRNNKGPEPPSGNSEPFGEEESLFLGRKVTLSKLYVAQLGERCQAEATAPTVPTPLRTARDLAEDGASAGL